MRCVVNYWRNLHETLHFADGNGDGRKDDGGDCGSQPLGALKWQTWDVRSETNTC